MGVFVSGADGKLKKVAGNARNLTFDNIYPVGSIYTSTNPKSPAELFGVGTWEQIKDRFLLGAGNTYTEIYKQNSDGTYSGIGGEVTHTLTIAEMPSHNHPYTYATSTYHTGYLLTKAAVNGNADATRNIGPDATWTGVGSKGGSGAHNNMPPYATVYMWQRVE
jgi:hypothetical protein